VVIISLESRVAARMKIEPPTFARMNFLGHVALSGSDDDVLFGNFVGDAIKGNQYQNWPVTISTGMLLHRLIDSFTDTHPLCRQVIKRIRPTFGKYSSVAIDLLWDHYLAIHWSRYFDSELENFVEEVYRKLDQRRTEMPPKTAHMFTYMKRDNWLLNYRTQEGIARAFSGLSKRIEWDNSLDKGGLFVVEHELEYFDEFDAFFKEIKFVTGEWLEAPKPL
jgi:acyl carrier protein phosphodiesterase